MEQSAIFRRAAIGATLAKAPLLIVFLLTILKIVKNPGIGLFTIALVVQIIGCLIWAWALYSSASYFEERGLPSFGSKLGAYVLFAAASFFLFITIGCQDSNDFLDMFSGYGYGYGSSKLTGAIAGYGLVAFFCTINPMLWIATTLLNQNVNGLNPAKTGYAIVSFLPLLGILFLGSSNGRNSDTIMIVLFIIIYIAAILSIIGWWICAKNSSDSESYEEDTTIQQSQEYAPQPTFNQPAPSQAYNPTSAQSNTSVMPQMANENTVFAPAPMPGVQQAPPQSVLAKQAYLEKLRDCPDQVLVDMIHSAPGKYDFNELSTASMILFHRNSPVIYQDIQYNTQEVLRRIAQSENEYLDGYVMAARRILGMA